MAVSNGIIGFVLNNNTQVNCNQIIIYGYNHKIHYGMYKLPFPERVNNAYLPIIYLLLNIYFLHSNMSVN